MKKIINILHKSYMLAIPRYTQVSLKLCRALGTSGLREFTRNLVLSLFFISFINLKTEEQISAKEKTELAPTEPINKCANCHQCPNNNSSLNQADPTPAIVLTNFAQMAVHFGNIVGDPKNKPVVQQNVCNIMACVANAAAQAFRNLKLDNHDLENCSDEEISKEIYRYLFSSLTPTLKLRRAGDILGLPGVASCEDGDERPLEKIM